VWGEGELDLPAQKHTLKTRETKNIQRASGMRFMTNLGIWRKRYEIWSLNAYHTYYYPGLGKKTQGKILLEEVVV